MFYLNKILVLGIFGRVESSLTYTPDLSAILCRMIVGHPETQSTHLFAFEILFNVIYDSMTLLGGRVTFSMYVYMYMCFKRFLYLESLLAWFYYKPENTSSRNKIHPLPFHLSFLLEDFPLLFIDLNWLQIQILLQRK